MNDDANTKKREDRKKENQIRYNVATAKTLFNCKEKMSFETMVKMFVKNHQTRVMCWRILLGHEKLPFGDD